MVPEEILSAVDERGDEILLYFAEDVDVAEFFNGDLFVYPRSRVESKSDVVRTVSEVPFEKLTFAGPGIIQTRTYQR